MAGNSNSMRRMITYGFFGFAYAANTTFLALLLTGAGHGWGSAMNCWLGIFVVPVLGVARAIGDTRTRRVMLCLVIFGMLLVDGIILMNTAHEGWSYARNVFRHGSMIAIPWLIAWAAWQFLAVWWLFQRRVNSASVA